MNRPGKIWCLFLLLAIIVILCQCSSYAGKSLLTFFFDGVPDEESAKIISSDTSALFADTTGIKMDIEEMKAPLMVIHYPYKERECSACHDRSSLGSMVEPEPGLCYQCHEDLGGVHNYLHGPVAGGYCTACHHPHQAKSEKLLRFTGRELCFHCHNASDVFRNEMHQGLGEMVCVDCHNPHGGEDKYIFN